MGNPQAQNFVSFVSLDSLVIGLAAFHVTPKLPTTKLATSHYGKTDLNTYKTVLKSTPKLKPKIQY